MTKFKKERKKFSSRCTIDRCWRSYSRWNTTTDEKWCAKHWRAIPEDQRPVGVAVMQKVYY